MVVDGQVTTRFKRMIALKYRLGQMGLSLTHRCSKQLPLVIASPRYG